MTNRQRAIARVCALALPARNLLRESNPETADDRWASILGTGLTGLGVHDQELEVALAGLTESFDALTEGRDSDGPSEPEDGQGAHVDARKEPDAPKDPREGAKLSRYGQGLAYLAALVAEGIANRAKRDMAADDCVSIPGALAKAAVQAHATLHAFKAIGVSEDELISAQNLADLVTDDPAEFDALTEHLAAH